MDAPVAMSPVLNASIASVMKDWAEATALVLAFRSEATYADAAEMAVEVAWPWPESALDWELIA